jgi:predicted nucleic acid-binding protein
MTDPPRHGVVLDASAVVALLTDAGPAGAWVAAAVRGSALAAPELMPFEAANILRRHVQSGRLDLTAATLEHADLTALAVHYYVYAALADRVWQLRENYTANDAAYVALAELTETSLVTLDTRLARAPGARCTVMAYPAGQ